MATTVFFEETLKDVSGKNGKDVKLEFGRSSFNPDEGNTMYLRINGEIILLSRKTARRLCDATSSLDSYLRF